MSVGVLAAIGAAGYEPVLVTALHGDGIHVVRRCVDVPDLLASAATRQARVALLAADLPGLDADVISRIIGEGVAVVVVTAHAESSAATPLMAMGATAVVPVDDVEVVVATVLAAATRIAVPDEEDGQSAGVAALGDEEGRSGQVVAVWGPSGAPGRSVISLGLGAELAAMGRRALVIDADVYGGSLAQLLGMLDEASGLLAATREANAGTLRASTLSTHCRRLDDGLLVLTGLPRADRWAEAKSALVRTVLAAARELADITVVDCGFNLELDEEISYDTTAPRRNGATIEILERADTVIAVGQADPIGLSRLIRGLSELSVMIPTATPVVVINRVRPGLIWSHDEIADTVIRATGIHDLSWLPDDHASCDRAVVQGMSLREAAPNSKLSKGLRQLASAIAGDAPEPRRWSAYRRRR
jgi:MinD-like ATPase involved in chromosome partitioning or flagellar assembly